MKLVLEKKFFCLSQLKQLAGIDKWNDPVFHGSSASQESLALDKPRFAPQNYAANYLETAGL